MDLLSHRRFTFVSNRIGVLLAVLSLSVLGCLGSEDYQTVTVDDADHAEAHGDEHDHDAHTAPHGGELIKLGGHDYNAEVVLEADPKRLVVYLLDAHAEHAVALPSEPLHFTPDEGDPIVLEPSPQEGDTEGQASRFVATGGVIDSFDDLEDVHGSMKVTIEGTEFVGALDHDHDHGDHDHEGGGGHDHDDDHKHADGDHDHDEADHKHADGDKDEPAEE